MLNDLFYQSKKDGNVIDDAIKNFNSRSNHYVKNKNFSMSNDNSESNKNRANALSADKKPEMIHISWRSRQLPKFDVFIVKC